MESQSKNIIVVILLLIVPFGYNAQFNITYVKKANLISIDNDKTHQSFQIDFTNVKYSQKYPKVKTRLGSYKVKLRGGKSLANFKLIRQSNDSIIFSDKAKLISFSISQLDSVSVDLKLSANFPIEHWEVPFLREMNENVYGGGIQFSSYNDFERDYVNISQENGIGRGGGSISKWTKLAGVRGESSATYCPVTYFNTSSNRSFDIQSYAYNEIDFNQEHILFKIAETSPFIELGISKNQIIKPAYNLPKWSLGTIVGVQGGAQQVTEKVNKLLSAGAHVDAVWFQDWVGKRQTQYGSRLNWTWELDTNQYIKFDNFRAHFDSLDIKMLGYINPFFAEQGKYITEGLKKDYFIKENDQSKLFNYGGMKGYMLDIFNPSAYQWMKQIIKTNLIDNGFSGWMADFAEWFPIKSKSSQTSSDLYKHNLYPVLWSKLNYEVIKESKKELFFFNRSGGNDSPKYSSMMWLGDQMTDFTPEDGLLSVIDGYLSASESGLPIVHSDVGGYTGVKKPMIKNVIRTHDVLKEWMLLEAFTPVFRSHEGILPLANSQIYNKEIIDLYAKYTNIHNALIPYFDSLVKSEKTFVKRLPNGQKGFSVGDEIMIVDVSNAKNSTAPKGFLRLNKDGSIITSSNTTDRINILIANRLFLKVKSFL